MRQHTTKLLVASALAVGGVAVGVSAYAYFTAQGSGSGSAAVGTASPITLSAETAGPLFPGGPGQTVTVTAVNEGSGAQRVGTVTVTEISADDEDCDTSLNSPGAAFTIADIVIDTTLAPSGSTTGTGTLTMNDTADDQGDCQGAALTLTLSSN